MPDNKYAVPQVALVYTCPTCGRRIVLTTEEHETNSVTREQGHVLCIHCNLVRDTEHNSFTILLSSGAFRELEQKEAIKGKAKDEDSAVEMIHEMLDEVEHHLVEMRSELGQTDLSGVFGKGE